jgi:hypothetical protein
MHLEAFLPQRRAPMFRRHVIVSLLSIPTLAVLTVGCEDDEKATPQIIFDGRIERGTDNDCQDVGALFTIGDFGNQNVEPKVPSKAVKDGEAFDQGRVSVSCSVTPAGADEFNVSASVDLSGATGGFFTIDGKFKTTGEQKSIRAVFGSRRTTNRYDQSDRGCTVRYTTPFQGVASGRVWAEITCPRAVNDRAEKQCEGIAQFRFENCAQ